MLLSMEMDLCSNVEGSNMFRFLTVNHFSPLLLLTNPFVDANVKLLYIVLMLFGILNFQIYVTHPSHKDRHNSPLNFVFGKFQKRATKYTCITSLWFFLLNFLLITMVNPSLLNPGPRQLSVFYQNVQGLIPFSSLADLVPNLNMNKVLELQAYLNINKPDIVVLNETWLKKSILDSEVFPSNQYKVFRLDRSSRSHPPDLSNPKKFRKFGGGVLISIRSNIDASFKRISVRKGAEMLAVEVTIGQNKYVFCTVYRVGTLGDINHDSIYQSFKSLYKGRTLKKIFIIGDFNLSSANWPLDDGDINSLNRIDKLFVDSFSAFVLDF